MPRLVLGLSILGLFLAFSPKPPASATPPERCVLSRVAHAGDRCVECPASSAQPRSCAAEHAPHGFALRCRTAGDDAWREIWCQRAEDAEPEAEVEAPAVETTPAVPAPSRAMDPRAQVEASAEAPAAADPVPPLRPEASAGANSPESDQGGSCDVASGRAVGPGLWLVALFILVSRRRAEPRAER